MNIYMYVSDSECINEQLYEKIVKSIVIGQCTHVVKVNIHVYSRHLHGQLYEKEFRVKTYSCDYR